MSKPYAAFKVEIPDTELNREAYDDLGDDSLAVAQEVADALEALGFDSVKVTPT